MKNKKILFFDENQDPNAEKRYRRWESISKTNLSISKVSRDSSNSKQTKPGHRISVTDKASQKIRVVKTKEGFLFQKKYMIYEIQCTLSRGISSLDLDHQILNQHLETSQLSGNDRTDEDYLYFNLQTNLIGVTKDQVRHNYALQKDSSCYVEIRTQDYEMISLTVPNKRVEFIQIEDSDFNLEDFDITVVDPIKLLETSQNVRELKIKDFKRTMEEKRCNEGRPTSKSLNFCWSLESSVDNVETYYRSHKKSEHEIPTIGLSSAQAPGQRQLSRNKKLSSGGQKLGGRKSFSKAIISQLAKNNEKDLSFDQKIANIDSSKRIKMSSSMIVNETAYRRPIGKQNMLREDAYGLEEIGPKRGRIRTNMISQMQKMQQTNQYDYTFKKHI